MSPDKKELRNRWKYGVLFGTASVLLLYNYWTIVLLGFLASLTAGLEYVKLLFGAYKRTNEKPQVLAGEIGVLTSLIPGTFLLSGICIFFGRLDFLVILYALVIPVLGGIGVFVYQDHSKINEIMNNVILGIFYIALPLACILYIYRTYGWLYSLYAITSPWLFDSFAFFVGIKYGKHKLMPKISPKKTVEGLLGGMFFTFLGLILITVLFKWIYPVIHFFGNGQGIQLSVLELLILTLFITWGATLGDLYESSIKRYHQTKDSGDIMPGHGGLLDRIDSLVFVGPMTLLLLLMIK